MKYGQQTGPFLGRVAFCGLSGPFKSIGNLCYSRRCRVRCKSDNSIANNVIQQKRSFSMRSKRRERVRGVHGAGDVWLSKIALSVFSIGRYAVLTKACQIKGWPTSLIAGVKPAVHLKPQKWQCQSQNCTAWGHCSMGRVGHGHGPLKVLFGWATMHLAPPIIGLYFRYF